MSTVIFLYSIRAEKGNGQNQVPELFLILLVGVRLSNPNVIVRTAFVFACKLCQTLSGHTLCLNHKQVQSKHNTGSPSVALRSRV